MRPIATHVVHSVVCVCVYVLDTYTWAVQKPPNRLRCRLGADSWAWGTLMTVPTQFHVACASIILLSIRTPQRITQSMGSFIVWYLPDGATAAVEAWICRNAPWRGQCSVVVRPVAKLVCSLFLLSPILSVLIPFRRPIESFRLVYRIREGSSKSICVCTVHYEIVVY